MKKKIPVVKEAKNLTPTIKYKTHPAEKADLVEVRDSNLLVSIDLKRIADEAIAATQLEENQKFFPYAAAARLMVGWQAVNFISSFELRITSDHPLPSLVVRFAENMSKDDQEKIDPILREQIMQQIDLVRQYPFVTVECPLL